MPEAFEQCRLNGGKIITKKLKGDKYIHLCKLNGKWTSGEVRTKKEVN
jgi:hypothetical protein